MQTDRVVRDALTECLAAVAKGLPPKRAEVLLVPTAGDLANALEAKPGLVARRTLSECLAAVAKGPSPEAAARNLARALARETDPDVRRTLADGLAAAAKELPPEKAARGFAYMLTVSHGTDLAYVLAAVAKGLPPEQAEAVLASVAQALGATLVESIDSVERRGVAASLAVVAGPLPPDRGAWHLIDCSGRFPDVSSVLSPAIGELASRASLERVVEWLKYPLCYGEAAAAILSQIKTLDGKTFRTRWELVEWLQKNRPEIDLTSPPSDPDRSSQR
jgi:hypothetical protein